MPRQQFGGDWTERKLQSLKKYLEAYRKVMKNQPFKTFYIDAFAGTGYRERKGEAEKGLLSGLIDIESEKFAKGSATIALEVKPQFDKYIFVERSAAKHAELKSLKDKYASSPDQIEVHNEDAAIVIEKLCSQNWIANRWRGVIFLDPFGMEVSWQIIESIAGTRALDLWLLFPLGIGVNRMLTGSGQIPAQWRSRLNDLFGTDNWLTEFYSRKESGQLKLWDNGSEEELQKDIDCSGIAKYFNDRLKTIFAGVAENPLMLMNSKNNPIYLLCFAVGNTAGAKHALNIAQHILKG